ncbi:MAG: hypothetical protein AW12_01555 [Candidatus Accumulibacter sp. BA-94]|nr:MAG: hypothetical protein AW12_01555 [Candidatus Accumulibacter sp. BA-94]
MKSRTRERMRDGVIGSARLFAENRQSNLFRSRRKAIFGPPTRAAVAGPGGGQRQPGVAGGERLQRTVVSRGSCLAAGDHALTQASWLTCVTCRRWPLCIIQRFEPPHRGDVHELVDQSLPRARSR